jgi:predicted NUDIX family NTP pyrophosphohydrolase
MSLCSAGILLYRFVGGRLEVMLVHPGGPYWAHKDDGAWTIPKGLCEAHEAPLEAARREFGEETGFEVDGRFIELGELKQPSGKIIHAWAVEQDVDPAGIVSNTFSLEWPPNSGMTRQFPEVDKGQWFGIEEARRKILRGQAGFLDRLVRRVAGKGTESR